MLSRTCALYVHRVYDGDAVFDYPFTLGQISKWDYFHPNVDGQNVLAAITYRVGFGW